MIYNVSQRKVFLLLCTAILNIVVFSKFHPPSDLDYSPFREGIRHALDTSDDIVKPLVDYYSANVTSNDCYMPKSSIMFTYANHHVMDLIIFQHKAMEAHNLRHCLESRFVTACFDAKCMRVCKHANIPNCVLITTPNPMMPASDFREGFYYWFTYIKHELMVEALKVVDEIFFFDADVMLFRNPWFETTYGRDDNGKHNDCYSHTKLFT